jgi:hypothetical protein
MNKEMALDLLCIVEDCLDLISKEIESGLEPNKLLVAYIKEKLDLVLLYKGGQNESIG